MEMDVLASVTQQGNEGRVLQKRKQHVHRPSGSRENVTRYGQSKQFTPAGAHTWSARPLFPGTAETTEAVPLWPD